MESNRLISNMNFLSNNNMKSIYSILTICFFLGLGLISCSEEELEKREASGDGKHLQITISTTPSRVSTPMTKATKEDTERVNDLSVLIYDNSGNLIQEESKYYSTNGDNEGLSDLSEESTDGNDVSHTYTIPIEPGDKKVYLLANAGDVRNVLGTEESVKKYSVGLNGLDPQLVMFAEGQSFNVGNGNSQVSARLVRIYSMLTVQVNTGNLNSGVVITPLSLQLKHIPNQGYVTAPNKIGSNSVECVEEGTIIEAGNSSDFLKEGHDQAIPLFLYENMQGNGNNTGVHKDDESYKTPPTITEATKDREISGKDRTCSYIELIAKYSGGESKTDNDKIIYRFFLGENSYNNFDVERNCYYKLTLNLAGNGGTDEASWRVTKDFMGVITVSDAYVGYVAGSKTYIPIVGDIGDVVSYEITTNVVDDDKNTIFKGENLEKVSDTEGRFYVSALKNNINDYDNGRRTCTVTFTMKSGTQYTAKVTQVPRLVDPIAIFKNAKNTNPSVIKVKEYSAKTKNYDLLSSVGPWSATIESYSGSSGCWFEIRNDEGRADQQGSVIRGDGPVTFTYQPKSENNNSDDRVSNKNLSFAQDLNNADKARYGVILVKYHNEQCEHRIYVRQGYQPTTMGGSVWSMFNCLGEQSNGQQAYTSYPTETGWLFKGACDIAMSPYEPGYEVNPNSSLPCSDGRNRSFEAIPGSGPRQGVKNWVSSYGVAQRGPCPEGYRLASGQDFYNLFQNSTAYTGYVYDDDYPSGGNEDNLPYGYRMGSSGHEIVAGTGNHCNPAKGSLLVNKNGSSIFFTYGKGIKTKPAGGDNNLIDEIGVGHRGPDDRSKNSNGRYSRMGYLKYYEFLNWTSGNIEEHTYGAYYWGATKFSDSDRLSRVNFSYDLLDPNVEESYVDWDSSKGHTGIDSYLHGSFVRCVRSN